MPRWFIDSHAHLDSEKFQDDLDQVLSRAAAAGLTHIVCIGASDGMRTNSTTLALAEAFPQVYATVGVHPHDARIVDAAALAQIEAWTAHPKVVAIGETGLDYHYDHSPRDAQQRVFRQFIQLAKATKQPLVVHTREAEADTIAILREEAPEVPVVFHCFTSSAAMAAEAEALGYFLSFSGVLTFKGAAGDALREVAKHYPRDRVLVETDCPFLAPMPLRGKRNEPSFVVHTAQRLADLWDMPLTEAQALTGANTARFYGLDRREGGQAGA